MEGKPIGAQFSSIAMMVYSKIKQMAIPNGSQWRGQSNPTVGDMKFEDGW
jgi:hypothetical protein